MIDKSLLDTPVNAEPTSLPFLVECAESSRYLYLYSPHDQSPGFVVRMWWEDNGGICRHRAYATGPLQLPLPTNLHEQVATMMKRHGLSMSKATQAVVEESWSETQAEFERMLREREPVLNQECVVDGWKFEEVIHLGEFLKAAPRLENPDVVDGLATRILGNLGEGIFLDVTSFGGRFDEENGITDALRHLSAL